MKRTSFIAAAFAIALSVVPSNLRASDGKTIVDVAAGASPAYCFFFPKNQLLNRKSLLLSTHGSHCLQ